MKQYTLMLLLFCALWAGPAMAQNAQEQVEQSSATEDSDDKAPLAIEDGPSTSPQALEDAAVEAVDYEEIEELRVLERALVPDQQRDVKSLEIGYGVAVEDRLALEGRAPLDLVTAKRSTKDIDDPVFGLQVEVRGDLSASLKQVQEDLEAVREEKGELSLPFGLDVVDQPAVQQHLALFTDPGSRTIKIWLQRSGKWEPMINEILKEEGVPTDLLYLAMIESGYKTQVKSHANAGGMWQFVPGTAMDQGLVIDEWVDERFDPPKATRAAARYLAKQYNRFESWPLAMAAYNGGAGTVYKAIRRYNTNDYFKLVEYGAMYDETRRYSPKILAAALIGENPEAFGFEGLIKEEPWSFDEVDVPGDLRLSLVADAAGCEVEDLEALNPELLKKQTPPDRESYTLRIPKGTRSSFIAKFDDLEARYGGEHLRVPLRFGETVEMVAKRTGIAERVLREINGLSKHERASYGGELIVPSKSVEEKKAKEEDKVTVLLPKEEFAFDNKKRVFYQVNSGDTVDEIAEHFGLRRVQVALWNDLDLNAKLQSSLTLQLFLDPEQDTSDAVVLEESQVKAVVIGSKEYKELKQGKAKKKKGKYRSYKVKRGDTVSKIAKKFGVSVKDIVRWNNLDKKATIRRGMRLVIKK